MRRHNAPATVPTGDANGTTLSGPVSSFYLIPLKRPVPRVGNRVALSFVAAYSLLAPFCSIILETMHNNQKVGAVIAAAGNSSRMNGIDKMLAPLAGKAVIARVLAVFERCARVDQVVVVANPPNLAAIRDIIAREGFAKVSDVCLGGERRQDSVAAGLSQLEGCHWAVIHDGARPLVTGALVEAGLAAAQETGAAAAAVPVTDTIKINEKNNYVKETPPRERLWAVQTPQVFRFSLIAEAYRQCHSGVTDDASLVEKLGGRVKLYSGSYDNIKVTTPDGLILAEVLWQKREK
jgi:2-C-methyl-D-erythritol 4-phosphate cytidylyltransferase